MQWAVMPRVRWCTGVSASLILRGCSGLALESDDVRESSCACVCTCESRLLNRFIGHRSTDFLRNGDQGHFYSSRMNDWSVEGRESTMVVVPYVSFLQYRPSVHCPCVHKF